MLQLNDQICVGFIRGPDEFPVTDLDLERRFATYMIGIGGLVTVVRGGTP